MKKLTASLLAVMVLTGCVGFHSTTDTFDNNGKLAGKTRMSGFALFDANGQIQKARNSSALIVVGTNTYAPGTYIGEAAGNASSTNFVAALQAMSQMLNTLASKVP